MHMHTDLYIKYVLIDPYKLYLRNLTLSWECLRAMLYHGDKQICPLRI